MDINLGGKRAIVCGSTQGIALAIAEEMARSGAELTLIARNEEALNKVKSSLATENGQVHNIIVADFSDPHHLSDKINRFTENSDAHILVNNTGGPKSGQITEAAVTEFTEAFEKHDPTRIVEPDRLDQPTQSKHSLFPSHSLSAENDRLSSDSYHCF